MVILKIEKNKLYLSTEEVMDISPLIRTKYNLKKNDNIESLYDDISYEASLEKGIFLISLKDRTEKEIYLKLSEKYRNREMIKKAVRKLNELGYVNDLDYAISYINSKKYGKNRIAYNLLQKGIDKETLEMAYKEIEEGKEEDIDDKKIEKILNQKIKKILNCEDKAKRIKEEQKLIQYLARQGFPLDKILKKIREFQ